MSNLSPVIILGDSSTNSLGVIRAFGRRRIPVILISRKGEDSTVARSRYLSGYVALNAWNAFELEAALRSASRSSEAKGPYVVFPTSDAALLAYAQLKPRLSKEFTDCLPPGDLVDTCVHKDKFYQLADGHKWLIPKSIFLPLEKFKENGLKKKIDYPFALKPVESHTFVSRFDAKLFVINNQQELNLHLQQLEAASIPVLAQELIPGKEFFMMYFFISKNRKSVAVSGFRKVRQSPPDYGTGSLVENCWDEELIQRSLKLLDDLGYTGIGEVEYKLDQRTGEYKLLEVNARSNTFNRLPAKMGIDFEYLYYLDATGQLEDGLNLRPTSSKMRWIDFTKDVHSLKILRQNEAISFGEIIDSFRHLKIDGYFALDDPSPFLGELNEFMRGTWRHFLGKGRRTVHG